MHAGHDLKKAAHHLEGLEAKKSAGRVNRELQVDRDHDDSRRRVGPNNYEKLGLKLGKLEHLKRFHDWTYHKDGSMTFRELLGVSKGITYSKAELDEIASSISAA